MLTLMVLFKLICGFTSCTLCLPGLSGTPCWGVFPTMRPSTNTCAQGRLLMRSMPSLPDEVGSIGAADGAVVVSTGDALRDEALARDEPCELAA
jgi:hypothetical protein